MLEVGDQVTWFFGLDGRYSREPRKKGRVHSVIEPRFPALTPHGEEFILPNGDRIPKACVQFAESLEGTWRNTVSYLIESEPSEDGVRFYWPAAEDVQKVKEPGEPRVHLSLTLDQAEAIKDALEVYTRLGLGQLHILAEMVEAGTMPVKNGDPKAEDRFETSMHVRKLTSAIRAELGFVAGESYGVGNRNVSKNTHRAYETSRVLRQALAVHRDPNPSFRSVDYDGLIVRYLGDEPAPSCCITEE